MLSIQHLQKHWILERNRHLADLEIDLLASVVPSEGFADHLGKGLQGQGAEDRVLQVHTELSLQEIRLVVGYILTVPVCHRTHGNLNATIFVHGFHPPKTKDLVEVKPASVVIQNPSRQVVVVDKYRIEVQQGFDPILFAEVVKALESVQ